MLCLAAAAAQPSLSAAGDRLAGKKVIHWGFDAPGATYFCENIAAFQKLPFDGYVISLTADLDGKQRWTGWGAFGGMPLTEASLQREMGLLATTDFGRVQDNFLRLLVTCLNQDTAPLGAPNLLDDADWARVLNAARLFAQVCRVGKLKGILFDDEQYGGDFPYKNPWDYQNHPQKNSRTFAEFQAVYRRRGKEFMQALCSQCPDISVLWLMSNSMVYDSAGRNPKKLATVGYGLLPAFHDGMVEGAGPEATLIDGNEIFYPLMRYSTMATQRKDSLENSPKASQIPRLYRKKVGFGVGIMADINYNFLRTFYTDPDLLWRNHFSPERLQHAIHNGLVLSDKYVWVWSEGCVFDPRVNTAHPPAPQAYHDAVRAAHEPQDLSWEPALQPAAGTYDSAALLPKRSEAETFGDLMKTHDVIADLSKGWQTLYDPEIAVPDPHYPLPGRRRPLRIGEWFQNQGFPYQGASWSRRVFKIPASAKGRELTLAFGGVRGDFVFMYSDALASKLHGNWQMDCGPEDWKKPLIFGPDHPITKGLAAGEKNMISVYILNWDGPGGFYESIKLFAKKR